MESYITWPYQTAYHNCRITWVYNKLQYPGVVLSGLDVTPVASFLFLPVLQSREAVSDLAPVSSSGGGLLTLIFFRSRATASTNTGIKF